MANRITWEGTSSFQTGYILGEAKGFKARIEIFRISYTTNRHDIKAGTPYVTAHRLPFRGIERKFATVKLAQEHAERYLIFAFELMGFAPREEVEELRNRVTAALDNTSGDAQDAVTRAYEALEAP